MIASERVNCPVCMWTEAHTVRTSADIVTCAGCGVTYLRTRPTVRELEEWYQKYASNPGSHMKLPETLKQAKLSGLRRNDFMREVMEFVGSVKPDRGTSLLDIGCGWGAFLDNAKDIGFSVTGVGIFEEVESFVLNVLGIHVFEQQLEECPLGGPYKAVTMIHSLEHLPNTARSLGLIHDILEEDGWVCGIVPNFASYCSQRMREKWPWLDQNVHYVHFTPETLPKVLHAFGFAVHRIYTVSGDFYPAMLMEQVFQGNPKCLGPALHSRIKQIEADGQGEEIHFFAQRI
jgi:hypothetical protein